MEHLVITIQAPQPIDIWQKITKMASDFDCHITHIQGQRIAGENALTALICGNWNTIAKLETELQQLKTNEDILVTLKRSEPLADQIQLLPYIVQVISLEHISTLYHICKFFNENSIAIENLQFDNYISTATNAEMFSLNVSLGIPSITNIGELRERFMIFCDDLNIDGIIEPEKR